ncbi:MAG TPA: hypothetical protein VFQ61_35365 [Polyangiaceae bacterium]|nr:hypothetical protein [Polyangiaceae bacterium]
MRASGFFTGTLFLSLGFLFASSSRAAGARDAEATELQHRAMNTEYLAGKAGAAERTLLKALQRCGKDGCSQQVLAKLHRDLGVVYVAGLGKQAKGRKALARAVSYDRFIQLDPDLTTPELARVFKEVGGGKSEEVVLEEEPTAEAPAAELGEPEATPPEQVTGHRYWVSLHLQQDMLWHPSTNPACYGASYTCFGSGRVEYTDPIWDGEGNRTAAGFGLASTRLLIGFDRVFAKRWLLGARLGVAFGGAPTPKNGDKFLPLHAELRGTYLFGQSPLERLGFRPFAALGLGVAEIDGHVSVTYYVDEAGFQAGEAGKLDAWRKTGKLFVTPRVGTFYALSPKSMVSLELGTSIMFPTGGFAPAIAGGFSYGL